jgi:predicted metalloprotease
MQFNDRANLDTSQIEDRRGGGFSGGRGVAVGGGGLGLVVAIVMALVFGVNPFSGSDGSYVDTGNGYGSPYGDEVAGAQSGASDLGQECHTGADANAREDCRIVGYVNSIQQYWTDYFGKQGQQYEAAKTVFFTDSTSTGCGQATAEGATAEVRCEGRAVRRGLRAGPRVRAPHPGHHRHPRATPRQ